MEKNSIEMRKDDLRNLFNLYDSFTLDSLKCVFKYANDYDMEDSIKELEKISDLKYKNEIEDGCYEGCNERDFISLSGINNVYELTEEEAKYLKNIFEDALINLPDTIKNKELISEISDLLSDINQRINCVNDNNEELNTRELKSFFNKYNLVELKKMDIIFDYVKDFDVSEAINVKYQVYKEKMDDIESIFKSTFKDTNSGLLSLNNKTKNLTKRELNYFYNLVSSAAFFLSSIRDYEENYKFINEEFDEKSFPIDSMNELEDILYDEIEKRENKLKKIKIRLNIKK
ncbi:MAG: hypothetical protein J6O56_03455 [Bacilli bacterium]|nr:hypothetical protein [Bacilli bacterium]